jgi:hypothetical protein
MFRHKDRLLKQVRDIKKRNVNKEAKEGEKCGGTGGESFYSNVKIGQQHIEDMTGMKIHKNKLRHVVFDPINGDEPYDNHSPEEIKKAVQILDDSNLPENEYTHDKTKWKRNKEQTNKRNNDRLHKEDTHFC